MNPFGPVGQALRMMVRDWRSGDLRLLALAVMVAVAAVSCVGFFVDRLRLGLERDAAQYLGGDAALEADRPLEARWSDAAQRLGLQQTRSASFPSMAMHDSGAARSTTLVSVKAVWPGYPLRGELRVVDGQGRHVTVHGPEGGTVLVDAAVLESLGARIGDDIGLGRAHLRIAGVIEFEPDRSFQVVGFAPRLLLASVDLDATALIQPASRVSYRWMVAGARPAVQDLLAQLRPQLQRGQRLDTLEAGRPEFQRVLGRADRFLGLAALVSVFLSAVAIRGAARRFSLRRLDACALLRCLGVTQGRMAWLFTLEFTGVGLCASGAGLLLGLALHLVLVRLLSAVLVRDLPWPSCVPALQALSCGLLLLLAFALPPLEQLRRVPPLRVLRRDIGVPGPRALVAYACALAGAGALLVWSAGELRLGAIAGGGFLACIALFSAIAWLMLTGLRAWRRSRGARLGVVWRFALAGMERQRASSITQLVSIAVALMALLLLAIVRADLIDQWRGQAPPDAPNRFIINIQPDQADAVAARLRAAGVADVALEPMVRGRLVAIDGRPVGPEDYDDEQSRSLVEREFNLSYRADAPAHNTLVAGQWFAAGADELSIEKGIAARLHIGLGQRLRFDIAGQPVEARVSSLRSVSWDSLRVNFFVIMDPHLLADAPRSLITAFHLPPAAAGLTTDLVRSYPNLTVINTEQILGQVRGVLDQVIDAVQFLFGFSIVAGILVLTTALAATHDERVREAALLRALGATRRQLERAQQAQLLLLGALAGLLAALGAAATAWALAHFVFEFAFHVRAWVPLVALAAGMAAALGGSGLALRRVLQAPPLASLREA